MILSMLNTINDTMNMWNVFLLKYFL